MPTTETFILNKTEIDHKIKRMAYQIYEANVSETTVVIAGIVSNGYVLAEKLKKTLEKISPIKVTLCKVHIDKNNPIAPITTSIPPEAYANKSLVLVDDVLHSGTTLIYGVKHFLDMPLQQFKTAVLVDRNHKKYPIKADYKGISLSTSINENVSVIFEKGKDRAILE